MKTNKLYLYACLLLTLVGTTACNFLNVEPTNSQKAERSIQTPADARVALNGLMSEMTSSSYYGRNFMLYADARGGDLTIVSSGRGLDGLYLFSHTATSSSCSYFWTQGYHCIMLANNLIENISRLEADGKSGFDACKGQAYALRALFYFDLVRLYGAPYNCNKTALGVPEVLTTLTAQAQPARVSVEQNYRLILSDLALADSLLSGSRKNDNGYINYYGVQVLRARVALAMEDYTTALCCAEKVISSGAYSLYKPADWAASWTKRFASESIFELVINGENDLGTSSLAFYYMKKGQVKGAAGNFVVSDYCLQALAEDSSDVRWSVLGEDETGRSGALYKYAGSTALSGDGGPSYTAVNIKLFRLSEVYLMAAEAALRSGDKAAAADYLNAIRCRAPKLAAATEATIDLDMILLERQKELLGEGQRFFDLIRCNRTITFNDELGDIFVSFRPKTVDRTQFNCILPIAQDEINANPTLASQQNPGY